MKIILNILFILCMTTLFSQSSLHVKYKYEYHWEKMPSFVMPSYLTINNDKSLFVIDFGQNDADKNSGNKPLNVIGKNPIKNFYKDYLADKIYYTNAIAFTDLLTIDSINVFKWYLINETKNILGYECKKALMEHYGRKYFAYFTTELGFNHGGPWKFDGLPGVILEIYSLDEEFKITATDITLKNENTEIENPYKDVTKFINFKEYQEMYKKWYEENNKTIVTSFGNQIIQSAPKCKIECLID